MLKKRPVRARHGLNSHFYTYVTCIAVTAPHDVRGGHLEQLVANVGHRARRDDSSNEVLVQERERERGRCRGNPVAEDAQDDTENSPVYEIDQLVASQVVSQARRVKLLGIHGALPVGPVVRIELDCPEVVQRRQSQSAERLRGAEDR